MSRHQSAYRHHKGCSLAVCTVRLANVQRKDIYLGQWKSPPSKPEYARILSVISANGGIYSDASSHLTVNEALVRFVKFVDGYYLDPDGMPFLSGKKVKILLGYFRRMFGSIPVQDLGPVELQVIRSALIDKGFVRAQINKFIGIFRQTVCQSKCTSELQRNWKRFRGQELFREVRREADFA